MNDVPVIDTADRTEAINRLRAVWERGEQMAPEVMLALLQDDLDPHVIDAESHQIALSVIQLTEGAEDAHVIVEQWVDRMGEISNTILVAGWLIEDLLDADPAQQSRFKGLVRTRIQELTEMWDETFDPDNPKFAFPSP